MLTASDIVNKISFLVWVAFCTIEGHLFSVVFYVLLYFLLELF